MLSHNRTSPPTVRVGTPARPHPLALPPPPTPQPSPRRRPLPSPQCRGAYAPCSRAGSSAPRGVTWPPAPPHRRRHHPGTRLAFPRVGLAGGSTSPRQPSSSAIATPPGPSPGSAPFPGRARRGHVAQRLPRRRASHFAVYSVPARSPSSIVPRASGRARALPVRGSARPVGQPPPRVPVDRSFDAAREGSRARSRTAVPGSGRSRRAGGFAPPPP